MCLAGVKGRRIRELTSVVQKRFKFPEGSVELYAEKVGCCGSFILNVKSDEARLLTASTVKCTKYRRYGCGTVSVQCAHRM